jgi:hypothetical protein
MSNHDVYVSPLTPLEDIEAPIVEEELPAYSISDSGYHNINYYEDADQRADDVNDLGLGRHDNKSLMNRKEKNPEQQPQKSKPKEPPIMRWIRGDDGEPRPTLTKKKPRQWPPIFVITVILAEVGLFIASVAIGGFDSFLNNTMIGPPSATLVQLGAKVVCFLYIQLTM